MIELSLLIKNKNFMRTYSWHTEINNKHENMRTNWIERIFLKLLFLNKRKAKKFKVMDLLSKGFNEFAIDLFRQIYTSRSQGKSENKNNKKRTGTTR